MLSETTALPTEPQPLPKVYTLVWVGKKAEFVLHFSVNLLVIWFLQESFSVIYGSIKFDEDITSEKEETEDAFLCP